MVRTVFSILMVMVPALAFAAAGEAEGGEHGSELMGVVWQVVNFAILVAILIFIIKKADVKGLLRARTQGIEKSIEDAREAKELAQKALDEVRQRMGAKDKEIEEVIKASVQSGEKERERIVEEGQRLSQQILEQAKANVELEMKQARESLKAEAVRLAMEIAEKKIEGKIDEATQKRLLEEAIGKLEGRK